MDEKLKEKIRDIHDKYMIVDAHFDLLTYVEMKRALGYKKVIETEFLPDFRKSGVDVIVCSLYIETVFLPEMGLKKALDQVSALYAEIYESPDKIALCRTYDDILKSKSENKLSILLSLEGVDPLTNDLKLLRIFYELGVRMVGITWSRRNFAADGSHFANVDEGKKGGLTDFGVQIVKLAEKLGMIVDVSHINDEGFWDVMKISQKPVIASHSNCRALADSMRNLTDEQIKALSDKKGVIGMNVCSSFVSDKPENGDATHLAEHADYIAKLVGIEHVGLGFDFCDFLRMPAAIEPAVKPAKTNYDVIKGHKNIGRFTEALIKLGYSDDEIGMILGGNFLRLYKELLV
ncbi:MAG TPA: membrane dipeptidase [Clostridiaceae bacterium]|nr:membrane dipeptidase [Clostridiaceae bacterium]